MFGQAMATFVPPMLDGTVVFIRGYNPHEIVRQVKTRRISVLVSVPKILDVLADHVARLYPDVRETPPANEGVAKRWWRYRAVHRLFGLKFWSFVVGRCASRRVARSVLAPPWICRRPGLRPDRDRPDRHAESSVFDQ